MIARTSSEAYAEYQKLSRMEEKLEKRNRGLNIVNAYKFFKPSKFFIKIFFKAKQNLIGTESYFQIESNLPFISWEYSYHDKSVEDFLSDLEEWCLTPRYRIFIQKARKRDNKVMGNYHIKLRKYDILFEQVEFKIGKQAQHELNLIGFNFIECVKEILQTQRIATDEEIQDFERFHFLLQRIEDLGRQGTKRYSYYDNNPNPKISISDEEYNKKLRAVETEMIGLTKKYKFLSLPTFYYKEKEEFEE